MAEKLMSEIREMEQMADQLIQDAQLQSSRILDQARHEAQQARDATLQEANDAADRILSDADRDALMEKERIAEEYDAQYRACAETIAPKIPLAVQTVINMI